MKSHFTFLNHSSILISSPLTKILCDPWFGGTAFNDGWSLLDEESHDINDIEFDYIWISHEHPDHLSIPTLSKLKNKCTFLFQQTKDQKVKKYLESKGHKVIELENKKCKIIGDVSLTCIVCDDFDSSLLVKFPDGKVLLNINDSRVDLNNHVEIDIKPLIPSRGVDVMLFQYSYANWSGNDNDNVTPKYLQSLIDKKNDYVISVLKPRVIMPFAGFIYFSHEENFYCNKYDWLEHVCNRYSEENLIVPVPNQKVAISCDCKDFKLLNASAIEFWNNKRSIMTVKNKVNTKTVDEIKSDYDDFHRRILEKNNILFSRESEKNYFIDIFVIDLNLTVRVGLNKFQFEFVDDPACISVSSETLSFLFKYDYSRGTVLINGRIEFNYSLAYKFFIFFFIPYANNIGIFFNEVSSLNVRMLRSIKNSIVLAGLISSSQDYSSIVDNEINVFLEILGANLFDDDVCVEFECEPGNEFL